MISIETQISGGEIGRKLASDPEETWYALEELTDEAPGDFVEEVAMYATMDQSASKIASFLRKIADELEKPL